MKGNKSSAGFTIIELILATVILLLILGFAAALLSQGSSVHHQVSSRSSQQEQLDSITQLLIYDFRLAGYRGATTPSATLSEAITSQRDSVTIHYTLDADPSRPYEVPGAQTITYAVENNALTRCQAAAAAAPGNCYGGKTTLMDNILSFTADTTPLAGNGVIINILATPYDCTDTACATPYTVRVQFPQPLRIGGPQ